MFLLVTVPTDSVIIEAGIFYQSNPFAPPRWDVAAVVLIEVLAEEACTRGGEKEEFSLNTQSSAINPRFLCLLMPVEISVLWVCVTLSVCAIMRRITFLPVSFSLASLHSILG